MKNARKLARSRRHKDYFNECWDYVEFCGERMNMGVAYEKQKDYIKNLYKNEDYMTLEKVFRPYFKMMQKSLQKNELFAEDEGIFDMAFWVQFDTRGIVAEVGYTLDPYKDRDHWLFP